MSWTTTSEREEVAELSPEFSHIGDRSLSLVEGGGGSCRLSGKGLFYRILIILLTVHVLTYVTIVIFSLFRTYRFVIVLAVSHMYFSVQVVHNSNINKKNFSALI